MSYNIGIPEIICTQRLEDTKSISIKYEAEAASPIMVCPNPDCSHKHKPYKHSARYNLLRDIRSEGKLVFIHIKIQRYTCPDCGIMLRDTYSFYDPRTHMTKRLKDDFVRRCLNGETFRHIARDYGITDKTVAAAYKEYAATHKDELSLDYTPEVLGIDEAHIDDHFRLVLTDIKGQKLLDMKRDNKKSTIKAYLRTLDKEICKCATMDMAPLYAACVSEVLPNTTIVLDRFHVIQEANRCLDSKRREIVNAAKESGVKASKFKQSRYLFLANCEDLKSESIDKLVKWLIEYPDMYDAYMVKETLRAIYIIPMTKQQASEMFDLWLLGIPDWKQFSAMKKTFSLRKEQILNYWDYQWTNAYTESVNSRIKAIEKAGHGYKFENLRERCLLEINHPKPEKFDVKNAVYVPSETQPMMVKEEQVPYGVMMHNLYQPTETGYARTHNSKSETRKQDYILSFRDELKIYLECNIDRRSATNERIAMYARKIYQTQKERARG